MDIISCRQKLKQVREATTLQWDTMISWDNIRMQLNSWFSINKACLTIKTGHLLLLQSPGIIYISQQGDTDKIKIQDEILDVTGLFAFHKGYNASLLSDSWSRESHRKKDDYQGRTGQFSCIYLSCFHLFLAFTYRYSAVRKRKIINAHV